MGGKLQPTNLSSVIACKELESALSKTIELDREMRFSASYQTVVEVVGQKWFRSASDIL